jgi:hypothetical protein
MTANTVKNRIPKNHSIIALHNKSNFSMQMPFPPTSIRTLPIMHGMIIMEGREAKALIISGRGNILVTTKPNIMYTRHK